MNNNTLMCAQLLEMSGLDNPAKYNWFEVSDLVHGVTFPKLTELHLPYSYCAAVALMPFEDGVDRITSVLLKQEGDCVLAAMMLNTGNELYWVRIGVTKDTGQFFVEPATTSSALTEDESDSVFRTALWAARVIVGAPVGRKSYVPAPSSSNAKRARQHKKPMFTWTTVVIEPKPVAKAEPKGGTHASPRLHDRRGHWRNYKSGKQVWINTCKVGHAKDGIGFHDYEVRS